MSYDLVIKNGTVITPNDTFLADVAINGEQIAAIGQGLVGQREIDARGRYVLPGAIDAHVHLTDPRYAPLYTPGADSFGVGSRAAAIGGVTTFVDFASPYAGVNLVKELDVRQKEAEGEAVIDYAFNLTIRDTDPSRIGELHDIFDRGVTSIKMFMAYDGYRLNDATIFSAMEVIAERDGLAVVHAENDDIIRMLKARLAKEGKTGTEWYLSALPSATEGEAVHRVIAFAAHTGARLILYHQTCEEGVREIRHAKARGQSVYGEVCVAYLVYTSDDYERTLANGFSIQTSPPIREKRHQDALWQALADGTLDIVSTDHGPRKRPPGQPAHGISGIEARLALIHHFGVNAGRLSLNRWVEVCCTNPAKIFGLPKKGQLLPGYDADVVVFDPNKEFTFSAETLHSDIDYSSYDGISVRGYPQMTISRGEVVADGGSFVGKPGRGRFIERGTGKRSS
ncbi:dihydropyrimidinase [Mesorhizobium sp. BR1-1-9]|uniref:dihydropyrimidinase n=1 Tax=unclassified Mesorhizobium TaxID=325217 RepID=UPI00112650CA|nr:MULTISPECIES: dihydropyrimidinase [unclassified Mesorhizobium]MBZ9810256.1 dihydropyrimidinase [Mesorhizobium sp. ESP-6-2]MBZ9873236.1 dihydropyrimidinase [Mesorhizobium sp. BR1-1-9]MBZ9944953.1 dihydropyrimidinase [Mesorhizobium sp. BR1-1-13]TPM29436.1 dihydropyrimidinase [Mesorhizobium sp. B2-2-2]